MVSKLLIAMDNRCTHGIEKRIQVQLICHTATLHFNFPAHITSGCCMYGKVPSNAEVGA